MGFSRSTIVQYHKSHVLLLKTSRYQPNCGSVQSHLWKMMRVHSCAHWSPVSIGKEIFGTHGAHIACVRTKKTLRLLRLSPQGSHNMLVSLFPRESKRYWRKKNWWNMDMQGVLSLCSSLMFSACLKVAFFKHSKKRMKRNNPKDSNSLHHTHTFITPCAMVWGGFVIFSVHLALDHSGSSRFIRDLATSDDGNQKSETKPIVDSMKYCVHQLRLLVEIDHYLQGVLAPSQKVVVGQIFSINSIISSKKWILGSLFDSQLFVLWILKPPDHEDHSIDSMKGKSRGNSPRELKREKTRSPRCFDWRYCLTGMCFEDFSNASKPIGSFYPRPWKNSPNTENTTTQNLKVSTSPGESNRTSNSQVVFTRNCSMAGILRSKSTVWIVKFRKKNTE